MNEQDITPILKHQRQTRRKESQANAVLPLARTGEDLTGVASPAVPTQVPSVRVSQLLTHLDYRKYLSEWFAARKAVQTNYSGAQFAKRAGLQSHTLLSMVIRGERNLSPASTRSFIRALGIKGREALYFEKLVLFNQSKNSEDKAYYFEQLHALVTHAESGLITSIKNHASYLSHWYVVAIRELVHHVEFTPDPDWISKKLKRKVTPKQAKEAWEILIDLGLVARQKDGRFCVVDPSLDLNPGEVDFAIRNFHREYLDRTKEAIDGEPLEDRELSSVTFAASRDDLKSLREKICEFRKALILSASSGKKDVVVAVNMQSLVLTESDGIRRNQKE